MSRKKRIRNLRKGITMRTVSVAAGDDCPICALLAGAETHDLGYGITIASVSSAVAAEIERIAAEEQRRSNAS